MSHVADSIAEIHLTTLEEYLSTLLGGYRIWICHLQLLNMNKFFMLI